MHAGYCLSLRTPTTWGQFIGMFTIANLLLVLAELTLQFVHAPVNAGVGVAVVVIVVMRSSSSSSRLRELEEENRRLKQMYANLSLEHEVLKDIIEKKLSQ